MTQFITAIPKSLYELVYNQASHIWGNKMPLCGQHLARDPSIVSPVSVANFSADQHGADPSLQCVSKPMPFGSLCYVTWNGVSI
jgi:hypothetical protein